MEAFKYISSLLPSLKKHGILEDCNVTLDELRNTTIPAYRTAAELLKDWKFQSKEIQLNSNNFNNLVKGTVGKNMVVVINNRFENIVSNLETVEKMISATFNNEIAGEGLTYAKVNLIQFVEYTAFASKYARKFLSYLYLCETSEFDNSDTSVKDSISPYEQEWLRTNFVSFCNILNIVSGDTVHTKQSLHDIPEIVVTSENNQTLKETLGTKAIDPLNMGFIPVWLNPVYHIGMMFAEWQASRYKAAEEELKMLQLRHLYLSRLAEGQNDAGIRKQIEVVKRRVDDLNYRIAKMEK